MKKILVLLLVLSTACLSQGLRRAPLPGWSVVPVKASYAAKQVIGGVQKLYTSETRQAKTGYTPLMLLTTDTVATNNTITTYYFVDTLGFGTSVKDSTAFAMTDTMVYYWRGYVQTTFVLDETTGNSVAQQMYFLPYIVLPGQSYYIVHVAAASCRFKSKAGKLRTLLTFDDKY